MRPSARGLDGRPPDTVLQGMRPSARNLNERPPDTVLQLQCRPLKKTLKTEDLLNICWTIYNMTCICISSAARYGTSYGRRTLFARRGLFKWKNKSYWTEAQQNTEPAMDGWLFSPDEAFLREKRNHIGWKHSKIRDKLWLDDSCR